MCASFIPVILPVHSKLAGSTFEATFVYLIRNIGELEIHTDHGNIGLFKLEMWLNLFKEEGLDVAKIQLEH